MKHLRNFYRGSLSLRQPIFVVPKLNISNSNVEKYDADEILESFIKAAKGNDESLAERILNLPEFSLNEVKNGIDSLGNSPLMLCAQRNWSDSCSILLHLGCNPDHQNVFGSTALMCSAAQGHIDALRTLVSCNRVSINLRSRFGQTALMKAIVAGRLESVNILLEAGALVNISNKQGRTCLDLANDRGHSEIITKISLHSRNK